jgi:hypothetical protein
MVDPAASTPVPWLKLASDVSLRVPTALALDAEPCHDAGGDLLAYCWTADGTLRLYFPDLASFAYVPGSHAVTAVTHRNLTPDFLLDTYHHCALPLILPALGTSVLHASGVVGPNGVAAFCGASGTGKSTIAAALARRGYALWADDAVAVDVAGPRPITIPLPFASRLRPDAARWLGDAGTGAGPTARRTRDEQPTPLALLCMLRRAPDAREPVVIERLEAALACQAALGHAYCFSVKDPAQKRRTIESYLVLTSRVPAYEVRFRPDLEQLPTLLDAIEGLVR